MSFFKNLSEKAVSTAQAIGSKSQDMVEIGKHKVTIAQIEGDIKKLKLEIGELVYDAHEKSQEFPMELINKINQDISEKFGEIDDLKRKIQEIGEKTETETPAEDETVL